MYRANQQQQSQGGGQQRDQILLQGESGRLLTPVQIPFIEALLDETGEEVTLAAVVDWSGHSPSNYGVDRRGKQLIASFREITVVDPRAVPNEIATQLRQRVQQQGGQQQQRQQREAQLQN